MNSKTNTMSDRLSPAWDCPDLPMREINRITAERSFGNIDAYDLLTRIFACVYFNTSLPRNLLIKIDMNASDGFQHLLCYTPEDYEGEFWTHQSTERVVKTLVSLFSRVARLTIPLDFSMNKLRQQFLTVIVTGPRPFGASHHADHVRAIRKRYGHDKIKTKNSTVFTTENTHIVVKPALDWISGYRTLIVANAEDMRYISKLYLHDSDDLTHASRSTLLRTLAGIERDPYISLYFLDEKSNERCVFDANNF